MHVVTITDEEWRILRLAVVRHEAANSTDDRICTELHKKLADASEYRTVVLQIGASAK